MAEEGESVNLVESKSTQVVYLIFATNTSVEKNEPKLPTLASPNLIQPVSKRGLKIDQK